MKEKIKKELSSVVKIFFLCVAIFSVLMVVDYFNDKQEDALTKKSIQFVFNTYNEKNNTSFSVEEFTKNSSKTKFWTGKEFVVKNARNEEFTGYCFPVNSIWGPVMTVSIIPNNAVSFEDVIFCGIAGIQNDSELNTENSKTDLNQISFEFLSKKVWSAWCEKEK